MVPNPVDSAVKGSRHHVTCIRGQGVPLEVGNGGTEEIVQGLPHVEERNFVMEGLTPYDNGPREQVREEDDGIHVGIHHWLVQVREVVIERRGGMSRQRRLLC